MSFVKATKAIKPLLAMAEEYRDLVIAKGEKSDREQARIKVLAQEIVANWETLAQYEDDIERYCEHGPRTEVEEGMAKHFSERLRKLGGALWKAKGVDVLVVPERLKKDLKNISNHVVRWKRWMKKAPKRTASAEPGGGAGGDQAKEKAQDKQQALA